MAIRPSGTFLSASPRRPPLDPLPLWTAPPCPTPRYKGSLLLGKTLPFFIQKYLLTICHRSGLVSDTGDAAVEQKCPETDSCCQLCPRPSLSCRVHNEIRTQVKGLPNQKEIKACTEEMPDCICSPSDTALVLTG